jgi:hypothetical protein
MSIRRGVVDWRAPLPQIVQMARVSSLLILWFGSGKSSDASGRDNRTMCSVIFGSSERSLGANNRLRLVCAPAFGSAYVVPIRYRSAPSITLAAEIDATI